MTPELQRARAAVGDLQVGGRFDPLEDAVIERLLSGEPSFDLDPQTTADLFKKGVADPLLREFDLEIAPRLAQAFAGQGATFGSRRGFETGRALEGLQTTLASELSRAQFNNQGLQAQLAESAAGRQFQGLQASQAIQAAPFQRAAALTALGTPFQQFEQSRIQARFEEFQRTQPGLNPAVNQAIGFTGQQQAQLVQQGGSPFGAVAGLAGGLALGNAFNPTSGIFGGLFSA